MIRPARKRGGTTTERGLVWEENPARDQCGSVAPRTNPTKRRNLMSVGRIGARAALAAAGVLASVALMAAPSWAESGNPNPKGGNSNQAMACHGEAWVGIFNSHDECVSSTADKLK
jgi:hypothetical protein